MAKIEGLNKLVAQMRTRAAQVTKSGDVSILVGYTAAYAIYVHEDLEMKWRGFPRKSGLGEYWGPHGQAKFLEQPFRELSAELAMMVREGLRKGQTMAQALLVAGLRLQRASQQLVPVEYGNLRASAFTRLEEKGKAS